MERAHWIVLILMVIMDVALVYGIWIEWRRYRLLTRCASASVHGFKHGVESVKEAEAE